MLRTFTLMALSICTVASASAAGTNHDIRPQKKDTRVFITLVNKGVTFRDVKIDGHVYTLQPHDLLTVKGPAGMRSPATRSATTPATPSGRTATSAMATTAAPPRPPIAYSGRNAPIPDSRLG